MEKHRTSSLPEWSKCSEESSLQTEIEIKMESISRCGSPMPIEVVKLEMPDPEEFLPEDSLESVELASVYSVGTKIVANCENDNRQVPHKLVFPSSSHTSKKPRAYGHQSREIIYNVYKYLLDQKQMYNLDYNTVQSAADATGVSRTTIERIIREGKTRLLVVESCIPISSAPKRKHGGHNKVILDSSNRGLIRRKIHEFYVLKKGYPSIKKLFRMLKSSGCINFGMEVFRRKILEIGFQWEYCASGKRLLFEDPEIIASRIRYLQTVGDYRRCKRPIVYLDETYLILEETGAAASATKREKFNFLHTGGEMGFIDGALLIYSSQATTGAYQGDMNTANFTKWMEQMVIPKLPPNSAVVMDDADYHCEERYKKPTIIDTKAKMCEWLTQNGTEFSPKMSRAQLIEIIQMVSTPKEYVIDKTLEKYGHAALRLPPYHSDLNPIELVWDHVKDRVEKECLSNKLEDKKKFIEKCFVEYSQEMWKECCSYVKRIEDEYRRNDRLMDERVDNMIVTAPVEELSDESEEEL